MREIISWNVNGVRAVHKKGNLAEVFHMKPDILCLQETKALPDQLPQEARDPEGYHSYFHFPTVKKGYSGVAIYSKEKPLKITRDLGIEAFDQEGRLIMAEYKDFILINCYFPNGGGAPERLRYKLDFYDYFLEFIDKLSATGQADRLNKPIIFCGDVNVAHKAIDLARPKENETHIGFLPIERAWVDKLASHGWTDVFRHFHPEKTDAYTYWDMKSFARERNVGWRIDYFFASPEMLEKVKSIKILDEIMGSDHCPVKLTLKD
ncbi:MAG: exodeoxyribonuclease III [Candidatus Zambryskibacteria bacterium RIFCSPHIGHO2_12_FULL_48_10]|uniref:Exodeoxyribonuclease III n=1 Tax=Candidatus Zambryskibacteria bacterium RIFCSPHIGHO2_01_FULL_46_25 TaxID=1802738 RepID=A0A1G2SZS0_9BACT|nr:MAG: Exodeoxyribonuclease III [Parcubacteria group bacterium GW2011_GWA1_47_10]OHA90089.1 MAG: exodeoxyribonuclease III [Candidatus Zambryskibacteria bacterium RIFCSPHIGHO2_01_FULL_46_25]OHB00859.1 MAG: exodeoxyribonuclease III [Candidatus Zambryskibacteria bacterium RIFCSPHIGHO2_12_FULL_48_10]OHB06536.1 MAG: exodeoxyribonuclease III [Candidatus Zambryskibacteria bacterium RIFCSPLOWO2_01_FULL_48_25]